jgi:hypothetical protein
MYKRIRVNSVILMKLHILCEAFVKPVMYIFHYYKNMITLIVANNWRTMIEVNNRGKN